MLFPAKLQRWFSSITRLSLNSIKFIKGHQSIDVFLCRRVKTRYMVTGPLVLPRAWQKEGQTNRYREKKRRISRLV